MRVLVVCEFSGIVRDAFIARGHNAVSCDLEETEHTGPPHFKRDVREILADGWDLMIAHPPCTHLAVSGARWFGEKVEQQAAALQFVQDLWNAPIDKICIENPVSVLSTKWYRPSQVIQPWQFGHEESKTTCLWFRGLQPLIPTHVVNGKGISYIHREPPGPNRAKNRSRTYIGIAAAMAEQWGNNGN